MFKKLKSIGRSSQLDSIIKYLFATLLIFIPLYPKFPLFNFPGTYVAFRLEDTLIALLALLLIPKLISRQKLFKHRLVQTIFLYWLVSLLSVVSAILITHTAASTTAFLHWARRIEYMIPFFAALVLLERKDNLRFFTELLLPVALGVLAYALGQLYFDIPVITTQNEEFSKGIALTLQPGVNLSSTFAGHYDLATYLVMTVSLCITLAFAFKNKLNKWFYLLGLIALFWLFPQTGSRIGFAAIIGVTILSFYLVKKYFYLPVFLFILLFFGLSTPKLSGRFSNLLKIYQSQLQNKVKGVFDSRVSIAHTVYALESTSTPSSTVPTPTPTPTPELRPLQQDRSTSIRFDVEWPRALRALAKNPFLGTGFSSITLATDNDYLRALGETGILGFLSFFTLILSLITHIVTTLKHKLSLLEHHYLLGTLVMILGFLFIATFIDVFEASKVATLFWMYTGIAAGIGLQINKKFA